MTTSARQPTPSRVRQAAHRSRLSLTGTNELQGGLFEFHDKQPLRSRNYFQPAGRDKPLNIYNNYGGTLGGPIMKHKLFYFFGYDAMRQRLVGVATYSVPTADIRTGNFSAYLPTSAGGTSASGICAVIYDPLTGDPTSGAGRAPFPGQHHLRESHQADLAENPANFRC